MDIENKYGTLEIQKGLLVLLKKFDKFCISHDIKYGLDSGSLLGAIRHNGFIPWDDDLDVMIDRKSYNKLISDIKESKELVCFTDLWFTRVRLKDTAYKNQPTLDVFILDHAPDSAFLRKIRAFRISVLQSLFKGKPKKEGIPFVTYFRLLIGYIMGKPFSYSRKLKWYDKLASSSNNKPSKYVTSYYYLYRDLHVLYDSDVMEHLERCKFEDTEASVSQKYDQCLKAMYGDYMTPPKEEDRNPEHLGEREILNF